MNETYIVQALSATILIVGVMLACGLLAILCRLSGEKGAALAFGLVSSLLVGFCLVLLVNILSALR